MRGWIMSAFAIDPVNAIICKGPFVDQHSCGSAARSWVKGSLTVIERTISKADGPHLKPY